ncbi:MAG: TolC family protein [Alphaproteobacteria bacterium]|nr:TolC family protein [Alphaproteobacteria bacterium]
MKKLLASILAGVLMLSGAHARDLSFERAVEMVMAESNDLKKADANLKKAEASLDAANANRWFKVEGNATYMNLVNVRKPFSSEGVDLPPELGGLIAQMTGASQHVSIPDNIFMAGATITQPIYTFGKIGNAVDSVRSAIKMSESGKELARREVRYAAAQLYWTAKMTDGLVEIAEKSLSDAITARKKLTAAGRASRANLVKIEADVAAKEINLSDAKFNRDAAHRMLKIMAGIYVGEEMNLTTDFPNSFVHLNAGEIDSPEWDMLGEQIKMNEALASSKRAGNYPTLAAMASYNYVAMHTDYELWQGNKAQNAYWGLALSVPIFDGGLNRANATIAAQDAEAARQDLDKSKKIKSEEYNTAVHKYDHLRGNLSALNNARDLAEKAYGYSRDRFAAGQTSAVELSDVSAALAQMDIAVLNAKYNLLMAGEQVKRLTR